MNWQQAIKHVLKNEGGYANHEGDKGGETYCGIARKFHPGWAGWATIDAWKKDRSIKTNQIIPGLESLVIDFYKKNYWIACKCNKLPEILRLQVMDIAVNSGVGTAGILLQRSINMMHQQIIDEDGAIGPVTLKAARQNSRIINELLYCMRMEYYSRIVDSNPDQAKWLVDWWYLRGILTHAKSII